MADIEFNGSQGIVPDFALESTQENILAILKKQYKYSDQDIKNAKEALRNDNKNSKAQIDALKKLGVDISDAVSGKGTFFDNLTVAGGKAVGAFTSIVKVGAGVVAGLTAMGVGITTATLNLAKGFGDDLKSAGLAETGAAFGNLGTELDTVIPQIMTLGYSVEEAAGAINDFRGAMTATSGTAIQGVITQFNSLTQSGAMYGRTLSENLDFLAEEIEYRARLGFINEQNAAKAASQAQEVMDSQIAASKLLGKSVDEIANGVKDLFTGDIDIMAALANLGPDIEVELRKTFQTLEGAGLPKSFQAGLAKMLTDPIELGSQEAIDAFNALSVLPDNLGDQVRQDIDTFRAAVDMPQSTVDERKARDAAIAQANKNLEKNMLAMGKGINDLTDEQKDALFTQGQSIPLLRDLLSAQRGFAIAFENASDENRKVLNQQLRDSVLFDNQITSLTNSFGVIITAVKAGFGPALKSFTEALGDIADDNSPLGKFRVKLGRLATDITTRLKNIFGLDGSAEENQNTVTYYLELLAEYIGKAANLFVDLVQSFVDNDTTSLMDRISDFAMGLIKGAFTLIAEGLKEIDFVDLFMGPSQQEMEEGARRNLQQKQRRANQNKQPLEASDILQTVRPMIERMEKRGQSDEAIMQALRNVGVDPADTSILRELFPNPIDLRNAILDMYKDTDDGGQSVWKEVSAQIGEEIATAQLEAVDKQINAEARGTRRTRGGRTDDGGLAASTAELERLKEFQLELDRANKGYQRTDQNVFKESESGGPPVLMNQDEIAKAREEVIDAMGGSPTSSASIEKDPANAEPTTPGPTSQDGTPTQEVKPAIRHEDAIDNSNKTMEQLLAEQNTLLTEIKRNTSKTASGISTLPRD